MSTFDDKFVAQTYFINDESRKIRLRVKKLCLAACAQECPNILHVRANCIFG